MPKQALSVLVLICTTAGEVLLLRRADCPYFWQSVTGSVEPGETIQQTAQRELYEETGLMLSCGELVNCNFTTKFKIWRTFRHRYAKQDKYNTEHAFLFLLPFIPKQVILQTREHLEFIWLHKNQAKALVTSPSNKKIIEKFCPN